MDGPMERPHMGLIYIYIYVMCPRHGWCGWCFNHDNGFRTEWGCHGVVVWLTQPNTSVGALYMIFYGFTILKPICIMF